MLVTSLGHLLPGPCKHRWRTIHANHISHKRGQHACKISRARSRIQYGHVLVPGKEPGETFLKFGLVRARHVGVPGRGDLLKIISLMCFKMLQLFFRGCRKVEANQGIEVFKNLFVGQKKVFEMPSLVLLLKQLARPP